MPILSPQPRSISWGIICKGIGATIKAAAPNARVHNRWPMRYNLQSTIAMIMTDSNVIHSWMVSVKHPTMDIAKVGGTEYEYKLDFRIWGLQGYAYGTDTSNSEHTFYDEIDDVVATIKANANAPRIFGLTNLDGVDSIREVLLPSSFDIDTFGFSEGYDVHKAEGHMQVRIVR